MTPRLQELLEAYGIQGKDFDEIADAIDAAVEDFYNLGRRDGYTESEDNSDNVYQAGYDDGLEVGRAD